MERDEYTPNAAEKEDVEIFEAPGRARGRDRRLSREERRAMFMPTAARRDFRAPAEIDAELYEMAKRRVFERGALITHVAAYCASGFAMIIAAEMFWRLSGVFMAAGLLWGIGVFMHVVSYFVKGSPDKIMREYNKIARRDFRARRRD